MGHIHGEMAEAALSDPGDYVVYAQRAIRVDSIEHQ